MGSHDDEVMVQSISGCWNFIALTWSGYWLLPAYCILIHLSAADGSVASPLVSLCIKFWSDQVRSFISEKSIFPLIKRLQH